MLYAATVRALILAATVISVVIGLAEPVWGSPILTLTTAPPFLIVPEDLPGAFNVTVKNVSTGVVEIPLGGFGVSPIENINAAPGSPFYENVNQINNGIEFVSGDDNDKVTLARIVQGSDFCSGFNLGPQGTCLFSVFFNTADNNKPASDTNSGVWKIHLSIGFFPQGAQVQSNEHGSFLVEVIDPGAKAVLPEPSSLILFASGLLGWSGMVLGRRASQRRRSRER